MKNTTIVKILNEYYFSVISLCSTFLPTKYSQWQSKTKHNGEKS